MILMLLEHHEIIVFDFPQNKRGRYFVPFYHIDLLFLIIYLCSLFYCIIQFLRVWQQK